MMFCYNAGDSHGPCKYLGYYQAGGGWSSRSFIWCTFLEEKIFLIPPIPNIHKDETAECIIPLSCPMKRKKKKEEDQLSLFFI